MKRFVYFTCMTFLFACTSSPHSNLIALDYEDFGPQVIASELIGMQWWQWQSHGDSRPQKEDIRVIVYKDVPLRLVKEAFPVDQSKLEDYRYIDCQSAYTYLQAKIQEDVLEEVTRQLSTTYQYISDNLCHFTDVKDGNMAKDFGIRNTL